MRKKYFLLLAIATIMLIVQSCVKNEYELDKITGSSWNPNVAVPLIHSQLSLYNVLEDYDTSNLFIQDITNFLTLVYFDTVFSQSAEELIQIPNQNISTSYNFIIPAALAVGDSAVITFTVYQDIPMGNSERIDSMLLKAGLFGVNITSDLNYDAKIEMEIPNLTKNAQIFKSYIPYSYTSSIPSQRTFALSGYKMIPDNVLPADNRIQINYRLVVYGNGNPTSVSYHIAMGEALLNLKFYNIFGYLGQHNTNLDNEQILIKLFKNNYIGILRFEDPRFHLFVYNSIGMPLRISIDSIEAFRTKTPATSVVVTGSGIPNPWNINYPSLAEYGQTKTSSMSLDKTNSNIKAAIDIVPQEVVARVSGITNPDGPGATSNFALDVSKLTVEARAELPLYGIAQDFTIVDTVDMVIGDITEDIDKLKWINFRLNIINSFPVDCWIQLYFLDSTDVVLDSLLSPIDQLIIAATPGPAPDYITTNKRYKQTNILKNNAYIKNIVDVKKVCIKAIMDTYQNGTQVTKFYSHYDLDIRLGVQAQFGFE